MLQLHDTELQHFRSFDWIRIPGAFSTDAASSMRKVIRSALRQVGIIRDDPATRTKTRPEQLQHLKRDPVFRAIDTERIVGAIKEALADQATAHAKGLGRFLSAFSDEWHMGCAQQRKSLQRLP